MKFSCLVLDHDDTVVNSTAMIHYPAFLEYMKTARPGLSMSLEEYFSLNFDPGVTALFQDICGLSKEECRQEEAFWREFVKTRIPQVYPGIREILWKYKNAGGRICVVSHSYSDYIRRDYACGGLPEPDVIFGWDLPAEKRKPSPFAIEQIAEAFQAAPEEILVVDDLKPGYDMARAAGVKIAAAGWANDVEKIRQFMRKNCDYYLKTVEQFGGFLLQEV